MICEYCTTQQKADGREACKNCGAPIPFESISTIAAGGLSLGSMGRLSTNTVLLGSAAALLLLIKR
jgi:hypothetical protein